MAYLPFLKPYTVNDTLCSNLGMCRDHCSKECLVLYERSPLTKPDVSAGEPDLCIWKETDSGYWCIVLWNEAALNNVGHVLIPYGHPFYTPKQQISRSLGTPDSRFFLRHPMEVLGVNTSWHRDGRHLASEVMRAILKRPYMHFQGYEFMGMLDRCNLYAHYGAPASRDRFNVALNDNPFIPVFSPYDNVISVVRKTISLAAKLKEVERRGW